jgi:uncharacterized integral membrane protein
MNRPNDDLTRTNQQRSAESGSNGPNLALIGFAIVAILAVTFFFQNGSRAPVHFLMFERHARVRWSILVSVACGIVLDRLFGFWWRRRKRKQNED